MATALAEKPKQRKRRDTSGMHTYEITFPPSDEYDLILELHRTRRPLNVDAAQRIIRTKNYSPDAAITGLLAVNGKRQIADKASYDFYSGSIRVRRVEKSGKYQSEEPLINLNRGRVSTEGMRHAVAYALAQSLYRDHGDEADLPAWLAGSETAVSRMPDREVRRAFATYLKPHDKMVPLSFFPKPVTGQIREAYFK